MLYTLTGFVLISGNTVGLLAIPISACIALGVIVQKNEALLYKEHQCKRRRKISQILIKETDLDTGKITWYTKTYITEYY